MNKFNNLIFAFLLLFIVHCTLKIEDCMSQWLYQSIGASGIPFDMKFFDANTGIISTNSATLYRTTNGGQNWALTPYHFAIFEMQKIDSTCIYTHCRNYQVDDLILRTYDKGLTWDSVAISADNTYLGMYFINRDTGWISGFNGNNYMIWRTTNGGITLQTQITNVGWGKIFFFKYKINGEYHGWCSHNDGMYKTTNSGVNWFSPGGYLGINVTVQQITMIDENTGWVTTGDTCIWKTTNGGTNYFKQYMPSHQSFLWNQIGRFKIINQNIIYGVGGVKWYGPANVRGIIWKTTNGGTNWGYQQPDTTIHNSRYYTVDFIDSLTGWCENIHTTNGGGQIIYVGINNLSNEIPEDFKLFQNYPNPFNAMTKIKFDVAKTGDRSQNSVVKLKIYDILGREIATLVNDNLNPGSYEVTFNGSKFPSGVYFYKLTVGEYSETKKMLMIK